MALHREIEGAQPLPAERVPGRREPRPAASPGHLATGTLACAACDAPVLPAPGGMAPRDPIACGFCGHTGRVRDFLSLTKPTRPARVTVRVLAIMPPCPRSVPRSAPSSPIARSHT